MANDATLQKSLKDGQPRREIERWWQTSNTLWFNGNKSDAPACDDRNLLSKVTEGKHVTRVTDSKSRV